MGFEKAEVRGVLGQQVIEPTQTELAAPSKLPPKKNKVLPCSAWKDFVFFGRQFERLQRLASLSQHRRPVLTKGTQSL